MNSNNFLFKDYAKVLIGAINTVDQKQIHHLYEHIESLIGTKSNIYLLGNGGSQANAHHISGDFMKTFSLAGLKLKISCLSDNVCHLTAASNDVSFEESYSMLVNSFIDKEDFIVFLSGSGNSLNLVKCAREAKLKGICQAAITGFNGGALNEIVDIPVHIAINDMEVAEDIQLSIFHYIKLKLMSNYPENFQTSEMPKYQKRTIEDLIS